MAPKRRQSDESESSRRRRRSRGHGHGGPGIESFCSRAEEEENDDEEEEDAEVYGDGDGDGDADADEEGKAEGEEDGVDGDGELRVSLQEDRTVEEEEEEEDDAGAPLAAFSAHLVGAAFYPNAIKWSEDNLIAVATSQLITILNPAFIEGPRGSVSASLEQPFKVGRIKPIDLQAPCLLPICLSRDTKAMVRSMDWSPQGFSPTGGCMLAVCTKDFHVKLYHAPHTEFQCEWVEVLDLSQIVYHHFFKGGIKDDGQSAHGSKSARRQFSSKDGDETKNRLAGGSNSVDSDLNYLANPKLKADADIPRVEVNCSVDVRKAFNSDCESNNPSGVSNALALASFHKSALLNTENTHLQSTMTVAHPDSQIFCSTESKLSSSQQNRFQDCSVKVCNIDTNEAVVSNISPSLYKKYSNMLSFVVVACSPTLGIKNHRDDTSGCIAENAMLIALGSKSGEVSLLRITMPRDYSLEKVTFAPEVSMIGVFEAHESWVSVLSWAKGYKSENNGHSTPSGDEEVLLVTGSCDGSVKLWVGDCHDFHDGKPNKVPLTLIRKVIFEDLIPVTAVALIVPDLASNNLQIAVGKASGGVFAFEIKRKQGLFSEASQPNAHSQLVTGLVWAFEGGCLYSCSQDNSLQVWRFTGNDLISVPFPEDVTSDPEPLDDSLVLPNSVLDGYFGLDISKGNLSLTTVRGVSSELLDQMYQSRAMKAVAQVFWVGGQVLNPLVSGNLANSKINTTCWEANILAALHHFENPAYKLVLWDVITSLIQISSIVGTPFLNLVFSKWLSSLGLVENNSEENTFLVCSTYFKESLSRVSCRCLHIMYVLLKRLYLTESMHDGAVKSVPQKCAGQSECHQRSWKECFLEVEHELKERLVHFTLTSQLLKYKEHKKSQMNDSSDGDSAGFICMWKWARKSFEVQNITQMLAQYLNDSGQTSSELCYVCKSEIPFLSSESGECQGDQHHKLPRCSVTFKICPANLCWFCNCCGRWASKPIPRAFLSLPSKSSLEVLLYRPHNILETTDSEATCPYCGILMQRFVPDFLLRLSLI